MPLIDLPLAKLHQYRGINPRPPDFDAYWAEAVRELDAVDPEPRLVPSTECVLPGAECFDLWFRGAGGARIHAKYARPRLGGPHPAVLVFHGYSGNCGDWFEKLSWVAAGFCIAALDCRGQGGLSEDNGAVLGTTFRGHIVRGLEDPDPRKLLFRQIYLDTLQLARVVLRLPEVDPARAGCWGGSQGGALSLVCGALEPRIRKVATVYPFLCDYRRVWEMDLARDAYQELAEHFRRFDPRHEREEDFFTRLGYIDCQHLAPRIKGDVLMFTGLMDTVCPPSTQFAAYNRITARKDVMIYPDFGHDYLPGHLDHILRFLQTL